MTVVPSQVTLAVTPETLAELPLALLPASGAVTPAAQAAYATLLTVLPSTVEIVTFVISSDEALVPSASATQEVAAAAWFSFWTDWAFEAAAVVALVVIVTWPAALAIAVLLVVPSEEVDVTDETFWAAPAALKGNMSEEADGKLRWKEFTMLHYHWRTWC